MKVGVGSAGPVYRFGLPDLWLAWCGAGVLAWVPQRNPAAVLGEET